MKPTAGHSLLLRCALGILLAGCVQPLAAQDSSPAIKTRASSSVSESATTLEHEFFATIRSGDAGKFLSYIPASGVNVGPQAQHTAKTDIEQQFQAHHGLYCKLFDAACIDAPIQLDNSSRPCSYRDLLNHSEKVRTAATSTTRNGVDQAILVAEVKNDACPNDRLIDFIFNLQADGWKLFSIP